MRRVCFLAPVALSLAAPAIGGCTTSGTVPYSAAGDGGMSSPDGGGPQMPTCMGMMATQTRPATNRCTGDPTMCLAGNAGTHGSFAVKPMQRCASVYRTFPQGTAQPLQSQLVANDDSWAFSGLSPWEHYYVVLIDNFRISTTSGNSIPAIIGPLTVPSGPADAGTLDASVKPVQLSLLESSAAGGPWQVQWASAHVFDPGLGAEIATAQVGVVIGATTTTMPWQGADAAVGASSYFVQFAQPPAAQPTYGVLTADPSLGFAPPEWSLVAAQPSFQGSITSPADGANVPADAGLAVTWTPQPSADFELTELFVRSGGAWKAAYTSPRPNDPTSSGETIPSLPGPGQYLINLSFAKANCPPTADGCVFASAIAAAQFTAQ
jgi:hypothetical protein